MKRIKKLASLLLALVMIFTMSATVFAAEPEDMENPETTVADDITTEEGSTEEDATTNSVTHTYEIYQIFIGDYADGVLSNIKWGGNSQHRTGEPVDNAVLEELEAIMGASSDTEKLAVINKYANLDSTPMQTGSGTKYTGLTPGYYLVKDKDGSLTGTNVPYTLYVVQVVDDTLEFKPKGDVPTTDKKIVEGENKVETNEASIGDEVNYEITGTMPSNIADYKTYYYMFTDTLSKGLTYKTDSIKVTVNGVDVTNYFYKGVGTYDETAGTTIEVGILDIKALSLLTNPAVGNITEDTKVILTYTATLNENAVIAGDGNPNDVKLDYSNDPNNSGNGSTTPPENPDKPQPEDPTGETPKVEVVTYTTELTILKTDEDNKFLPGVEFTLTGNGVNIVLVTEEKFEEAADGEYWKLKDGTYTKTAPTVADDETDNTADYDSVDTKYTKTTSVVAKGNGKTETDVVGTVQADGTVTFKGLGAGEYTITETKTLPGYNTIEPIQFTLTFDPVSKTFKSDNDKVTVGEDNTLDTSIVNQKGSLLPSTGGIGTTIFYVVGGILVIGAGILLVTKKRMSAR
jgi:fimbrial isopeptide formation D2 family protein/LPXTG-motif cell wall-anchored protein